MSCIQEGITKSQWYMQGSKKVKQDYSKQWVYTSDWYIYEREKAKETNCKADSNIPVWRAANESNIIIFNKKNIKTQTRTQLQETLQSWI